MTSVTAGIYAVLLLSSTLALPFKGMRDNKTPAANNFVGDGTNELATAILQGYVDLESNLAFSPLGYSALLAILAEGARGDTREQLINALNLPEDPQVTRSAYKAVLGRLNERNSVTHPEFRNWFYIYRNFSVEPDYKTVLQENYLTEVKDVDRLDKDAVREEAESMEASEPAPVAGDAALPEVNIKGVKPEKSEVAEPMALEEVIDPVLPEKTKEIMPEKNKEGDKTTDKTDDSISYSETEEIMQHSDEDLTNKKQGGPLKIVFPIPFPEEVKLREKCDEKEASTSGAVLTLQEEMLGSEKEMEKVDDKNRDEKTETEKTDEAKGAETTGEKMEIPGDTKKEVTTEEIKDEIKNDNIKESGKMELVKDEKEGNKMEATKTDRVESMTDDKKDISQHEKMEAPKDEKMEETKEGQLEELKDEKLEETTDDKTEAKEDDKMEKMTGDIMKATNGDKMEAVKDDKMEEMKGDKMEVEKEEKTDETKNEKTETMKDNQMETTKDDKMEATKDDKMEATKGEKMEATKEDSMQPAKGDEMKEKKADRLDAMKGDQMEATKDDKIEEINTDKLEVTKDDKMQAMNDDTMEATKVDKLEVIKDDKTETVNGDTMTNGQENERTDSMVEGMKDEVITDDIKKEETVMEGDEIKKEDVKPGAVMSDPVNEKEEVLVAAKRKARRLDLPRLSRTYLQSDDVTSSLSSNNIVRKDIKSEKISQMLVFNGLYFKGIWATPFVAQMEGSFYKSDSEKVAVTMMNTQGNFKVGNVPDLDSVAIELPYKGGRYSLLVLVPNSRSGLSQLISDLAGYSLRNVQKNLQLQEVEVCLPCFQIQTITKPIDSLKKFGVSDIFSREKADLSCISKDSGLFVEELVQLVTVKVENGSSSYNHITAGNPSTRSKLFTFVADHPFLYFVRDTEDNVIVVAGKVIDPSDRRKSL